MATKKKASGKESRYGDFKGFVNFTLSKTDKENIRSSIADGINPMPLLHDLLESGYSVKFQWDSYADCPTVMLFASESKDDNKGWATSCRHSDLEVALHGLLYQHYQLSGPDCQWPIPTGINSEYDW